MKSVSMHILAVVCLSMVCGFFSPAFAQSKEGREQWMNELAQYRRGYFTKELDLTREQQNRFFPLYEEMEEQTRRIEEDAKLMESRVAGASDATDLEYEKAAEAAADAKVRQASVEREYLDKFKAILSPKQLFEIKNVEKKFSRELIKQHHRLRSSRLAETK